MEFIRQQSADIYFFQEANNRPEPHLPYRFRTVSALAELFPEYYFAFSQQFGNLTDEFGLVPHGCLLMSRWPISAQETLYFDITYGEWDDEHCTEAEWVKFPAILQPARVTLPSNRTLWLGNLHGPVWYKGDEPTERRRRMVQTLCDFARHHPTWIVAGDSNAQATNPIWQPLAELGTSVFGLSVVTTFNMRHKNDPGYARAAVDVCWVSRDVNVVSRDCPHLDVSDHLPLVVEVEL